MTVRRYMPELTAFARFLHLVALAAWRQQPYIDHMDIDTSDPEQVKVWIRGQNTAWHSLRHIRLYLEVQG